jgi:hypothetical protein
LSPSSRATLVASTFLTAYMLIAGVALLVSPVGSVRVWWNGRSLIYLASSRLAQKSSPFIPCFVSVFRSHWRNHQRRL